MINEPRSGSDVFIGIYQKAYLAGCSVAGFRKNILISSPLKNPSQAPTTMFAGHGGLEDVEERARATCNQARKT
ncbi:hypothetical protein, partial [Xanthomonas melonis]|uniref:hypothetical protein n=1 Tax=Xanthomonas melonis TaxID=56456 RepID=UPI001E47C227